MVWTGVTNKKYIMPNKHTFLQNAIKDIDNNKPIWFTDSYTNPNTITKHLLSEENKYDSKDKLPKTDYDADKDKNFTIVFHSISLNCFCAWISCPINDKHRTTQKIIINLKEEKICNKNIEVYVIRC